MNIKWCSIIERNTGITGVTSLSIRCPVFTIYCFCKNPCTGCFAHTAWPAK